MNNNDLETVYSNSKNPFEKKNISQAYQSTDPIYFQSALAAINFHKPKPSDLVMDLGAGTGVSSQALLDSGVGDLIIADPSAAMLDQAKLRIGDRAKYLESSVEELAKKFTAMALSKKLDLIYALNCFHLFSNIDMVILNIKNVLKEDGRFIFNISMPSYRFKEISEEERAVLQSNLDFYSALYEKCDQESSQSEILATTIYYMASLLEGSDPNVYNQDKIELAFLNYDIKIEKYDEVILETESEYQLNIWRMMGQGFINDKDEVEKIVQSIKVPKNIKIRQAFFGAT